MNGETHRMVGLATGAGYAAFQAKGQPGLALFAEIFGGGIGGFYSGQLPDAIEPSISSWHRDTAHSITVAAGIVTAARTKVLAWQDFCREQAVKQQQDLLAATEPIDRLFCSMAAMFWCFLAGFVNGALLGTSRTSRWMPLRRARFLFFLRLDLWPLSWCTGSEIAWMMRRFSEARSLLGLVVGARNGAITGESDKRCWP